MPKAIAGGDKPAGADVIRVFLVFWGGSGVRGVEVFGFRVTGLEGLGFRGTLNPKRCFRIG